MGLCCVQGRGKRTLERTEWGRKIFRVDFWKGRRKEREKGGCTNLWEEPIFKSGMEEDVKILTAKTLINLVN